MNPNPSSDFADGNLAIWSKKQNVAVRFNTEVEQRTMYTPDQWTYLDEDSCGWGWFLTWESLRDVIR